MNKSKAAKALARFMSLHPHNIAQRTEAMLEHFRMFARHKIGGRAKAMVVTSSRLPRRNNALPSLSVPIQSFAFLT